MSNFRINRRTNDSYAIHKHELSFDLVENVSDHNASLGSSRLLHKRNRTKVYENTITRVGGITTDNVSDNNITNTEHVVGKTTVPAEIQCRCYILDTL